MSAFLGPIHVRMYGRVLAQDEMGEALLALAEQEGAAEGVRALADERTPAASRAPLETLIDQSNIHGWLNEAVVGCEERFALIVAGILAGHPERLPALREAMKGLGRRHRVPAQAGAEGAFAQMHDILLDGMPCDFPFEVTESSAEAVSWRVTSCPHAPYWLECDVETYYLLRDAWMEGALEDSGIVHARSGGMHSLRKER